MYRRSNLGSNEEEDGPSCVAVEVVLAYFVLLALDATAEGCAEFFLEINYHRALKLH